MRDHCARTSAELARPSVPQERALRDARQRAVMRDRLQSQNSSEETTPEERSQQEDLRLIAQIRAGRTEQWAILFTKHQQRLFAICYRMVRDREMAEDLVQDAVVKIIKGLDSYDNRARLSTWMTRVAINVVLTRLRSEKYRRHASLDSMMTAGEQNGGDGRFDIAVSAARAGAGRSGVRRPDGTDAPQPEPEPSSAVESSELIVRMTDALAMVSDEQRAILLLRDAHDLEYEHIAEVLGVPVGTVKSRLFRARQALRKAMETLGSDGPDARVAQDDCGID
ncbi:MAG: sigma-70 family RNA polymerase sigma factor [Phycisphaeraceae bacterium]|nr:sigma-70 family RNA polymerase sigma factor [Phycisphaerales bacterium]MCB9859340.1 sigma-70 family RNA polymerase sigma factor [Phycisphaeraceae bacterium]